MVGHTELISVLLVEDDEDDYLITRDMLQAQERVRCAVEWLPSYDRALQAIREARHDVYIVDSLDKDLSYDKEKNVTVDNFKDRTSRLNTDLANTRTKLEEAEKNLRKSKENYDGAWGLGGASGQETPEARACNDIVARRTGAKYKPGTDAYGFTSLTCLQIQTLADAMNTAGQPLTQDSVIKALESKSSVPMNSGPPGSLSTPKHDAGDYLWIEKYSAATGTFGLVDPTPHKIP